jgi:hypothetical protein
MTTSNKLAAILAIVATLAATTAYAEPTAADLESARELYREGKELRQRGDLRGALERFKAAHGYGQTPVTGVELGKAHMQLGELVEAREVFLSIARLKVASDETDKSAQARAEAAELAEQVRGKIPTLVVKVSGTPPNTEPTVTIDGATVPIVALSSIRKVNPGEHAVAVRVGTHEEKRTVTVSESESKDVAIDFTGVPADAPAASPRRSIHPLTYVGVGLAAAGLAAGTVGGVLALGKASSVDDACNGLSCPPSAKSDVDDGRTFATISTIGFAATAAGLALAAVGLFVLKPKTAGALTGRFVF